MLNKFSNWNNFLTSKLSDKTNLKTSLKYKKEIERATEELINNIQQSAKQATPDLRQSSAEKDFPFEIRELVQEKDVQDPYGKEIIDQKTKVIQ